MNIYFSYIFILLYHRAENFSQIYVFLLKFWLSFNEKIKIYNVNYSTLISLGASCTPRAPPPITKFYMVFHDPLGTYFNVQVVLKFLSGAFMVFMTRFRPQHKCAFQNLYQNIGEQKNATFFQKFIKLWRNFSRLLVFSNILPIH